MPKRNLGGRRSAGSISQSHTGATVTGRSSAPLSNAPFSKMTDSEASQLRNDVDDRYEPDVLDAIKLYISDNNPNGDGFSHAQNLNYKLEHGLALNVNEKFIDKNIQLGMHDIGKNTELVRYCHDDILKACGIKNYATLSEAQLQQKLIGTEMKTTSYTSTSYDASKNPFSPGAAQGGGREVIMNIKANNQTQMVFGAKSQAEIILDKGTNFRITDVKYTGGTAYPRGSISGKPIVEITVETF